ncbi:MAG: flagellar export chaperone FliS, partial [Campylobacterota bacterium]|nr:flagellar export chaperone FliS [Campylobacterota bacterium]
MYANTAHNIYAQNNVGIESPEKLIEMLYEGVLRFNAQAKKAIKDKNIEKKFYWTNRS